MSRSLRLWVPLLVLILAALACSIEVNTAHLENPRLYKEPSREGSATRSFSRAETVYCLTDLRDADAPLPVEVVWLMVVTDGDQTAETELFRETVTAQNGALTFQYLPPSGEWTRGDYRIRLFLDDDREAELPFKIK